MSTTSRSHKTEDGSGKLFRRRDKRRHVGSNVLDLRSPFHVISLAVRYDESMNDEHVLQIPLETGGIYNTRLFTKALTHLERVTGTPSFTRTPRRRPPEGGTSATDQNSEFPTTTSSSSRETNQQEFVALTPIILSGLLANLESNKDDDEVNTSPPAATAEVSPTSTELVAYCTQMRRAALARVRLRKERQRVQRIVTPALLACGMALLYLYMMSNLQRAFVEFGFIDSCEHVAFQDYQIACRMAEANAWEYMNQPLQFVVGDNDCTIHSCPMVDSLDDDGSVPTYAIHTRLTQDIVPLDEIQGRRQRRRKRRTVQRGGPRRKASGKSHALPIQWLGDTTVNRLVRDVLVTTQNAIDNAGDGIKLLDVGSGLCGTLFSLMTSDFPLHGWTYHGITLSQPEVYRARQLVDIHQLGPSSLPSAVNVTISQGSYDDPLQPKKYTFAVAIESLAYSKNLTYTLLNLATSLKPNGVLVVVDDVVSPWADIDDVRQMVNWTARSSLLTHETWLSSFQLAGFQLHQPPRDLTLEFDVFDEDGYQGLSSFTPWYDLAYETAQWLSLERSNESSLSARAIHLVQDLAQNGRGRSMRLAAFRRSDLMYYMYVVRKR